MAIGPRGRPCTGNWKNLPDLLLCSQRPTERPPPRVRSAFLTYWLVPYCLPSIFPGWTTAHGRGDLSHLSPTVLQKDSRFPKTPWPPLCCEPSAPGRAQMLDVLAAEETDRTQAEGGRSCWPVGCGRMRGRAGENRSQKGSPVRRGL